MFGQFGDVGEGGRPSEEPSGHGPLFRWPERLHGGPAFPPQSGIAVSLSRKILAFIRPS